jgi:Transglycosylase SLT domain
VGAIRSLSKWGWAAGLLSCALAGSAFGGDTRTETVRFADPRWPAVKVVRGVPAASPIAERPFFQATPANTEIVSFGDGTGRTVSVVRGTAPALPSQGAAMPKDRVETVRFGGAGGPLVNIVRGGALADSGPALFGPANGGELDRVAFAVDGAESGHGSNPAMWRPELDGPQGPMQVSAAAALDVGGGDRFDLRQNRLLGRAFLAKMYQRYGNWPDAIAAYNWGPGNLDQWIAGGRPVDALPLETARYLLKVLRDAFLLRTPRL